MARGGRREGAGRKKKAGLPFAPKAVANCVLNSLGQDFKGQATLTEEEQWMSLLHSKDQRLRFDVLKYLTDRRDGKPLQLVRAEGEVEHDHSGQVNVSVEFIGAAN